MTRADDAGQPGQDPSGQDPSGQDAHNPETEEDTVSGGAPEEPDPSSVVE